MRVRGREIKDKVEIIVIDNSFRDIFFKRQGRNYAVPKMIAG